MYKTYYNLYCIRVYIIKLYVFFNGRTECYAHVSVKVRGSYHCNLGFIEMAVLYSILSSPNFCFVSKVKNKIQQLSPPFGIHE